MRTLRRVESNAPNNRRDRRKLELRNELIHAVHDVSADPDGHTTSQRLRRMRDALGAPVEDGIDPGEPTEQHAPILLAELVPGASYPLTFDHAQRESDPLRERAAASVRLVCDAPEAKPSERRPSQEP